MMHEEQKQWHTCRRRVCSLMFLPHFNVDCDLLLNRPENSNWWLLLPDSYLFLKFQNNLTAEFWATLSYELLLQRFFWNFFGILIMSMKADTRNCNKKYRQNFFYYTRFSLNTRVLLNVNFSRNIYRQWNRNISYYCRMMSVILCKVSQPSLLKRKSYDGKFFTAKCSNINDGATLKARL